VGVARFDPDKPLSIVALMQKADVEMYSNKMSKILELDHPVAAQPLTA